MDVAPAIQVQSLRFWQMIDVILCMRAMFRSGANSNSPTSDRTNSIQILLNIWLIVQRSKSILLQGWTDDCQRPSYWRLKARDYAEPLWTSSGTSVHKSWSARNDRSHHNGISLRALKSPKSSSELIPNPVWNGEYGSSNRLRLPWISPEKSIYKQLTVKFPESSFADVHKVPFYEHLGGRFRKFDG
jgi:hypothetical protein